MKQEKFIKTYDNLIHPSIVDQIENLLLSTPSPITYSYIKNITGGGDKPHQYIPAFSYSFIVQEPPIFTPPHFFLSHILYKLADSLNIQINNILKGRSFLQTPSPTPSPNSIHVDFDFPHWVCLYYVNDSDGDTILFDDNNNEIQRVSPKKGRIVFFDGSIKHCSSSPSKTARSIINFNFIGEYLDK